MNYVPNQNGKILEETEAGFNSKDMKTILRRLRYFKLPSLFCKSFTNFSLFPLSLCHTVESIINSSVI